MFSILITISSYYQHPTCCCIRDSVPHAASLIGLKSHHNFPCTFSGDCIRLTSLIHLVPRTNDPFLCLYSIGVMNSMILSQQTLKTLTFPLLLSFLLFPNNSHLWTQSHEAHPTSLSIKFKLPKSLHQNLLNPL